VFKVFGSYSAIVGVLRRLVSSIFLSRSILIVNYRLEKDTRILHSACECDVKMGSDGRLEYTSLGRTSCIGLGGLGMVIKDDNLAPGHIMLETTV